MAMSELSSSRLPAGGTAEFSLCTFCNNSTNGFEKRLFASSQPKGPFFPVLADLQGKGKKLDALGRAVVCVACFHHLLRQWSSFERRGIPVRKREYSIVTEDRVVRYQTRREEDIRREAELKIKEIQDRGEKIQKEAEQRFDNYQKRRAEIKREAEKQLLEEQRTLCEFERDSSDKLKEERHREEELRRQTEYRIQEEKEKREEIRREAERLLREEKVVEATRGSSSPATQSLNSQVVPRFRTEVILPARGVKAKEKSKESDSSLKAVAVQTETEDVDMESFIEDQERQTRSRRKKMMVYDPETGCYRKVKQEDDDNENAFQEIKPSERVEYRLRLRSDEKPSKTTEGNDTTDKEFENITVAMEPNQYTNKEGRRVHTVEQTITLNGKRRSEVADSKDEDVGGGDQPESTEMKTTGTDNDGSKYHSDLRSRRAVSEDSLEEKIKEMEKRRERLLLRRASGGHVQQKKGSEEEPAVDPSAESLSPRTGATSPVDDTKKKQRSRHERNKRRLTAEELSIRKSLGSEEDLFILTSKPADAKVLKLETKEEPKKNHEETLSQLVRPIGFEGLYDEVFVTKEVPVEASADLMSWGDTPDGPDTTSSKEASAAEFTQTTENSELLPKEFPDPESCEQRKNHEETPSQLVRPIGFEGLYDEVFVTKEDPVEASADLMSWGDTPDGPDTTSSKEAPAAEFRQTTENSEPLPKEFSDPAESRERAEDTEPAVDIEVSIPVARESAVESETAPTGLILDLDDETSTIEPATESISAWDNRGKSRSNTEEERRLREQEHEERKRRIVENQRRAAEELQAKKQAEGEVKLRDKGDDDPEIDRQSMREKRRSLMDLWESFSETQPQLISFDEDSHKPAEEIVIMSEDENRAQPIDPKQDDCTPKDMEVDERENAVPRSSTLLAFDENHKLSEDERKWESAGHFEPGRLQKTMFHNMTPTEEEPVVKPRKGSRYDWMKAETTADQKALVPTKLTLDWSDKQSTTDVKPSCVEVTESAPESPWVDTVENGERKSSSESDSDTSSEDERVPRVDVDELHKMTEDEKQWESAGHFQPKKLNSALLAGFQQGPSQEGQKTISKKDKASPYDMLKKMHKTTSQKELLVPTKLTVKTANSEPETVEIRPVQEFNTETEPGGVRFGSTIQDWKDESDSDDGVPEWRKVEERRRRQEQEEIERERQEEQKRQESRPVEEENETAPIDDEFEAKVRTKEVRRINPELLVQFTRQSDTKDGLHKVEDPRRETGASTRAMTAPDEDADVGDSRHDDADEGDDEFEQKVKNKQVKKLALEKSPFLQKTTEVEVPLVQKRSASKRSPQESKKDPGVVIIQEDEFVQRVADAVVESQPVVTSRSTEDDVYELKIKSKDVKKLNKAQVDFLGRQEEERGRVGEDELELLKRDQERRRRLEAEAEAKEERRIRLEEERRQQQTEERARREEEQRLRLEEVERRRQEEEERLLREEEMEQLAREEMRRQKEVAQRKFQSGVFVDDNVAELKDKDVASVGRLDSSMLVTFQQKSPDDSGLNVKARSKAQKATEEQQVEEARRQREEEKRGRVEVDELELLKRDDERRRRLEAEAEAKEGRRIRLEEERRQQQAEERARREEEQRLRLEEVERRRQEEEERLLREEEMERLAREEMRRQKEVAQRKFQSGVFVDDDVAQLKDKDVASVGRLDSSMLVTFQQKSPDDSGPNVRARTKAQKGAKEEGQVPHLESETVVSRSADVIESSPEVDLVDKGRREELEYEEKRKSVGRIDPAWYLKQQELQATENERRARELEAERIREEQNEIVKMKQQIIPQEYDGEALSADNDDSEKRTGKLSVDKLHQFQPETKEAPKNSEFRKSREQLITIERRSEVESAPLEFEDINYKEKRKSKGYENSNFIILGRDNAPEDHRKLRLQKERGEVLEDEERKQREEEQRAVALGEFEDESAEKPKNVGKLNPVQLSAFQQDRQDNAKVLQRKRDSEKERKVQEVVSVQRQEEVEESASNKTDHGEDHGRGPSMTAEEIEYEQSIKSAKALDVDKFLKSRSQEAMEREQRKRELAEERKRQEKEEMLTLRSEEQRRMLGHAEDIPDADYGSRSRPLVDSTQNRSESRSNVETDSKGSRTSSLSTEVYTAPESNVDKDRSGSVGRLPMDLRSTFESKEVTDMVDSRPPQRTKRTPSKYVIERSEDSSSRKQPHAAHQVDINGNVSPDGKESLNWASSRREAGGVAKYRDDVIESGSPEEKPVPKRLDSSLFAAFQKSSTQPAAPLRRAKSEKNLRPKHVGNVDLGMWQDDSGLIQSTASRRQREKGGHQPRPRSIAI